MPSFGYLAQSLQTNAARGMERLLFSSGPYIVGVAGMHQFSEIWVRDLSHASIGILARPHWQVGNESIPSTRIVSDIVLAFLDKISPEKTLAPRVLDSVSESSIVGKEDLLKLKVIKGSAALTKQYELSQNITQQPDFPHSPFVALYEGESGSKVTIDSNYMLVRAFARYAAATTPTELHETLLRKSGASFSVADKLRLTLGYYATDGLWKVFKGKVFLQQGIYEEWKDSIKIEGANSFTNLQAIETFEAAFFSDELLANALEGTPLCARRFGVSAFSRANASSVKRALLQWKRDVLHAFKLPNGLLLECETVPNVTHIDAHLQWLRVAKEEEFASAIKFDDIVSNFVAFGKNGSIENLPGTAVGTEWPSAEVAIEKRLVGLSNYHGSLAWSWLVGSFAHEAHVHGRHALRDAILSWMLNAQQSVSTSGFSDYISEVFRDGKILVGVPYTSETPFMWGSSYILWATEAILDTETRHMIFV